MHDWTSGTFCMLHLHPQYPEHLENLPYASSRRRKGSRSSCLLSLTFFSFQFLLSFGLLSVCRPSTPVQPPFFRALFLGFPHEPLSSSPLSRPASFSCCLPGSAGLFLRSPRGVSPAPSPPSLPSSPPSSLSVTLLRSPLTSGCLSAASPERLEGGLVVDRRVQLCVGVWEVSVRFSEYSAPLAGSHRP